MTQQTALFVLSFNHNWINQTIPSKIWTTSADNVVAAVKQVNESYTEKDSCQGYYLNTIQYLNCTVELKMILSIWDIHA